ncbi:MAG: penicillin-binding protein 1C [Alphaproteobacteria bacterium]|nr:penicillin-binding protein 1C [Alphaproteobacteria bacterium]MBV9692311.1 penicillin-binding protein 1C [Alphaproteobacteria bacterium]
MRSRLILTGLSLLGLACAIATADVANPPDMTRARMLSPEVTARDGSLLRAYLTRDGYWRIRTTPRDVSPRYLALLKAYEDRRFDSHEGVDPLAMARAVLQFARARHIVSGGSTLTMQVARLLEPRPRGVVTKLFQMLRAVQLEERHSKDEILSLYLTLAPFGGNLEGVRAASLSYFGKEPGGIDLAQAALLVALPQSPVRQRPDRHAIAALKGRDKVLKRMVEEGVVTASDARLAMKEGVPFARQKMPLMAPHLADRLVHRLKQPRIVTTLDPRFQGALERLAAQEAAYFDDGATLAVVAVENRTGNVLGYVGGTNYWGPAGQIDLANRARSPGSALKPFIYGMAFDELILHPLSMMQDAATNFGEYAPRDFDGGFQGEIAARDALRMSLNVPAVMVLDRVGPLAFTLMLQNAGARLAFPAHNAEGPSLPVALGGLGISLADITMLYAGIAERGQARALRLVDATPDAPRHRMFGPVAAYYLRDILDGVALPEGWAMGQGLDRKRTIGFKTGTSYGFRDAWSVGFSNDYTVGVWVGRADGTPRPGHIGRENAAPILLKTFELLPPDKRTAPAVPAGAILVDNADQLPPQLRLFRRETQARPEQVTIAPPPAIAFPPNGATVPLPEADAKDKTVVFKADGGRAPLTWLVNGTIIGTFDRFQPVVYAPRGEGIAHITVVDTEGRSDTSEVRFKKME